MKKINKKVILGSLVGALATLLLTFGILFGLITFSDGINVSTANVVISTITVLLAPVTGGFVAGLIGRSNPQHSGTFSGLIASLVIFIAWIVISGLNGSTLLSGVVIVFIWVMLARLAAGFLKPKMES